MFNKTIMTNICVTGRCSMRNDLTLRISSSDNPSVSIETLSSTDSDLLDDSIGHVCKTQWVIIEHTPKVELSMGRAIIESAFCGSRNPRTTGSSGYRSLGLPDPRTIGSSD